MIFRFEYCGKSVTVKSDSAGEAMVKANRALSPYGGVWMERKAYNNDRMYPVQTYYWSKGNYLD